MEGLEQQAYEAQMLNNEKNMPDGEQACETAKSSKPAEGFKDVEKEEPNIKMAVDCTMEAREGLAATSTENGRIEKRLLPLVHYDFISENESEPPLMDPSNAQRYIEQGRPSGSTLPTRQRDCLFFKNHHNTREMLQPDISFKSSNPYNAMRQIYSLGTEKRSLKSFDQSLWKVTTAEDALQVVPGPSLIASSRSFGMMDCRWQLNVSDCLLLSNEACNDEGLRIISSENWKDRGEGETRRCKVSSCPSHTELSADSSMPATSNMTLPETFEYEAHSVSFEIEDCGDNNARYVANEVTPLEADYRKASRVDGAPKSTSISNFKGRATDTNYEDGVISETLEMVNLAQNTLQWKNARHGALDLLVNAVQATSGSLSNEEDKKEEKAGRKDTHNSQLWSVEAHLVSGRSPILKKRVMRRAKSAFKKPTSKESVQKIFELQVSLSVAGPSQRRHRSRSTSEQQPQQQGTRTKRMGVSSLHDAELLNDGAPVIRSKRGRFQTLPIRFYDSILQPWKRKSRTQAKGRLEMS